MLRNLICIKIDRKIFISSDSCDYEILERPVVRFLAINKSALDYIIFGSVWCLGEVRWRHRSGPPPSYTSQLLFSHVLDARGAASLKRTWFLFAFRPRNTPYAFAEP